MTRSITSSSAPLARAWLRSPSHGIDGTTPPTDRPTDRSEGIILIFEGGRLSPDQTRAIRLPPKEVQDWAFTPASDLHHRLITLVARRVETCLHAGTDTATAYLGNGTPTPQPGPRPRFERACAIRESQVRQTGLVGPC